MEASVAAVSRWTGSWLSGPSSAGYASDDRPVPGVRLGLPADGPASLASAGRRVVAFLIDAVACGLLAGLFTAPEAPRNWSLVVLAVYYPLTTAFLGQTFGMRLLRIRVARLADGRPPALPYAVVRTILLMLLIPAVIWDRDRRGLHDRAAGTVVLRT